MDEVKDLLKSLVDMALGQKAKNSINFQEGADMEKSEIKALFLECLGEFKATNEAEKEEEGKKCVNEDKRKIIDEVGGILKGKVDEEIWRTVIGKLEKIAYNPSETDKADNKCKNVEDEEEKEKSEKEYDKLKEDVEKEAKEKAKNAIEEQKNIFNAGEIKKAASGYLTQSKALELGKQLF